jgi:hypothetical protein
MVMATYFYWFNYDDKNGEKQTIFGTNVDDIKKKIFAINEKAQPEFCYAIDASIVTFERRDEDGTRM